MIIRAIGATRGGKTEASETSRKRMIERLRERKQRQNKD